MSYTLYRPESLEEAIRLSQETGGRYLAGGTVSLVNYHKRKEIGDVQISLDRLEELKGIRFENGVLSIGAAVTMDELEQSESVRTHAYALWQAACELGGPQIRNRATLGGNLAAASPSSDCATPLLAMDARLELLGPAGSRTVALRDFFLGRFRHILEEGELIVAVTLDCPEGAVSSFRKVGKRSALSVSCLNMAVFREGARVEVAVGAAAPKPVYCEKTSRLLSEGAPFAAALEAVQSEICPIDDRWATASYRRTVCGNLLEDMIR